VASAVSMGYGMLWVKLPKTPETRKQEQKIAIKKG
jgi:hypothetical protein